MRSVASVRDLSAARDAVAAGGCDGLREPVTRLADELAANAAELPKTPSRRTCGPPAR